ncbi:hypothetical protein ACMU_18005 [Actibacterium mucosum KCTC 23349]|uniref:Sulfotransferase domain-containing protein n=1 Tax=Actibacterium mucosum KCTC 23349 TaxID=1454373 RepID=A0A037ZIE7_9RHOB|nr:sulfotransferase [Actibacterium mucosum]KAJ54600.1 hypothetical protein ACMU_18005 [Actibacterium mucosum KCTC 23349]
MNFRDHPAFLMIGSMKSGTTSVFLDMVQHPEIYAPSIKEPADLCSDDVLSEKGRNSYAKVFGGAKAGQWIGEASPHYTRHPHYKDVPRRALEVFGPDLKLIFIGRDPVERMRSHFRHEVQNGTVTTSMLDEIQKNPVLKDVSRYDMQLAQWLEVFPREQLLVLDMKDYIEDPKAVVHRVWAFLGLEPVEMDLGIVANQSAGKRAPRGIVRKVKRSRFYGLYIKPLLSPEMRTRIRHLLVPARATKFDDQLPDALVKELASELDSDTKQFRSWVVEDRGEAV